VSALCEETVVGVSEWKKARNVPVTIKHAAPQRSEAIKIRRLKKPE
jgi:hypothetical protein